MARHASPKFWDRIAARYAKQPIDDEDAYRKKLATTRSYLRPEMRVLELGCGTGSTAIEHAPHVEHLHAVDISEKMLAIARERAAEAGVGNVHFTCAPLDEFDAGEACWDAVLALSVLHLLDDRVETLERIHRMLVPGGLFVSSTICLGDTRAYLRFIAPPLRMIGLVPYLEVFSASELEGEIRATGFSIEERYQPDPGSALFLVARKS